MAKFEVAIYNEDVRNAVQEGERHKNLSDDWADIHYLEVNAASEGEARIKMLAKYPENLGYVIDSVAPVLKPTHE